jgi:AcrR family transcriptional regulator
MVRRNVIFAGILIQGSALSGNKMKEKLIIEAAQKRFGLYGIEKTAMREIADDLKLSKASLYYYFPDKESLYKAVVEKEQGEFLSLMSDRIISLDNAEELLREYATSRLSFFRTLLNLSRLRLQEYSDLKPHIKQTFLAFREKEKEIIVTIINRGIDDKIFFCEDPSEAAVLFLDLLRGVRMSILNERNTLVLGQDEFEMFLKKTNSVADIFIRGLKYSNQVG